MNLNLLTYSILPISMVCSTNVTLLIYVAHALFCSFGKRSFMIKFVFLFPLTLCLIWYAYLSYNGHSVADGKKGFIYITIVSAVIIAFFAIVWLITRP